MFFSRLLSRFIKLKAINLKWFKNLLFILGIFFIFINNNFANTLNTWDVLRKQFTLNHHVDNTLVKKQIKWLSSHPSYIEDLIQSKPFIYHIVNELIKRKLPGEIALIPMIESDFDPFVHSHKGAAGIWQLMPETAHDLGLRQTKWFDPRRNVFQSTNAALNYFAYLNKFFHGDWLLTFAAYDSGENKLSRIMKAQKQKNFWRLNVPKETKNYVPRLLALAEVIKNPQRYNVKLPNITYTPYLEEVTIKSQINLMRAATLAEISYREMIKLNSGFIKLSTLPDKTSKLLLPIEKAENFKKNLASLNTKEKARLALHKEPKSYIVKKGDTLKKIASNNHITTSKLTELNPNLKNYKLKTGQKLFLA